MRAKLVKSLDPHQPLDPPSLTPRQTVKAAEAALCAAAVEYESQAGISPLAEVGAGNWLRSCALVYARAARAAGLIP